MTDSNAFCVKICDINKMDNIEAFFTLANDSAVSHALSAEIPNYHCYTEDIFFSLLIDTGCARVGSRGYAQYRA